MSDRDLDIVLFGATGFTGGLTAGYLAAHAPAGLRWALAGRDLGRLAAVRERLGVDVELLRADVTDPDSLATLATWGIDPCHPKGRAPRHSGHSRQVRRAPQGHPAVPTTSL